MSRPAKLWIAGVLFLIVVMALLLLSDRMRQRSQPAPQAISLRMLVDAEDGAFSAPARPWRLSLPKDQGAHSDFQAELWTFLLWLGNAEARPQTIQIVLGRAAVAARPLERASAWAASQIYGARLWAQGAEGLAPLVRQRLQRAALGLAGSGTEPPRVWIDDWSFETAPDTGEMRLKVQDRDLSLDVMLRSVKTPLAETDLLLFGGDPDAAPGRGYSLTRLQVAGELALDGSRSQVAGTAWLDHVWGNLGADALRLQIGRLAAQLDDGRELLCLELERTGGGGRPIPSCALVLQDGRVQSFQRREIALDREGSAWRLEIPLLQLQLDFDPGATRSRSGNAQSGWGIPIAVSGREAGRAIQGWGWAGQGGADWLR